MLYYLVYCKVVIVSWLHMPPAAITEERNYTYEFLPKLWCEKTAAAR